MRKLLLHLNFSLALAMLVLIYVDNRNPMMGFLACPLGYAYLFSFAGLTALNCALSLFRKPRRKSRQPASQAASGRAVKEDYPQPIPVRRPSSVTETELSASHRIPAPRTTGEPPRTSSSDFDSLMSEIDNLLK